MSEKDLEKAAFDEFYRRIVHLVDLLGAEATARSAFFAAHASRDAEVAKLEARVKELEKWLFESEMTGNFHRCSKCPDIHKEPNDQK